MSWRMLITSLVTLTVATGTAWAMRTGVPQGACPSGMVKTGQGCPYTSGGVVRSCPYGHNQLPPGHPTTKTTAKGRVRA